MHRTFAIRCVAVATLVSFVSSCCPRAGHFLAQFGIIVGGYVASIGEISADFGDMPYEERFTRAEESDVRCPIDASAQKMRDEIEKTIHGKNTLWCARNCCAQSSRWA